MMNLIKGWHLPDWDTHYEHTLKEHKGKWEYQKDTRDFSLEHCNNFEAEAIDVGGNVGFWSRDLSERFKFVHAFEPHPDNQLAFTTNMVNTNYTLYPVAVSNEKQSDVDFFSSPDECGNMSLNEWGVQTGNTQRKLESDRLSKMKVDVVTIDEYNFNNVGFMKVDVQGNERNVVLGAEQTLKNNNITLVLELPMDHARTTYKEEQKEHDAIAEILKEWGYTKKGQLRKEAVFQK
jgi:FkbM family methyltransferase